MESQVFNTEPKVIMDINRSFSELTALRSSDLIINGQTVNLSLAKDDELSPGVK